MSTADKIFKEMCKDILTNGVWDTDYGVRPRWEDGTPAHTIKKFGIVNRYDLQESFPILTLRKLISGLQLMNSYGYGRKNQIT